MFFYQAISYIYWMSSKAGPGLPHFPITALIPGYLTLDLICQYPSAIPAYHQWNANNINRLIPKQNSCNP